MTGLKAAIKHRRQLAKKNRHVAKLGRTVYKKKSADHYRRKLMKMIEKEKLIAFRKGQSKKKG